MAADPSTTPVPCESDDLVDAVRRSVRAVRASTVDTAARERARTLIEEASRILEEDRLPGPFWQTGFTSLDQFDLQADPTSLFPYSPATGHRNPVSPRMEVTVGDDGVVRATAVFTEQFNGPPFDVCHGGVIALVYDDLVGLAAMVGSGGGMTARLTVDYRRPTPLFVPIEISAWFTELDGRKMYARGEMRHDGELLNEAEGLFIRPPGFPPGAATG